MAHRIHVSLANLHGKLDQADDLQSQPLTNGSAGGKLPAGKGAARSPAWSFSAAVREAATNQE
jgi:hypothetical protein